MLGDNVQNEVVDHVSAIADSILSSEGMELVEIGYRRESKGWVLRLYIDKEGGVTLDDCTRISQEIGRSLDVEDFISASYILEISSPGLDRPLRKEKDFLKYRNRTIRLKTLSPIEHRRQFTGKLLGINDNCIELERDEGVIQIPLSNLAKANLEIDPFDSGWGGRLNASIFGKGGRKGNRQGFPKTEPIK